MLTIYKASAGSGKTYTLAYEYVRLLLGVKCPDGAYRLNSRKYLGSDVVASHHRNIIAMTFTNKATEEMKKRIVDELDALASEHDDKGCDSPYASGLIDEYGCTRDELREVAAKALRSLLFDYHHFNVSTIDSFFQTVLRAFAREVDRQGDYGVELNDEFAVVSGIGLMLDDLNYGNPPRRGEIMRWISNYTMEFVENGKDSSMFNRSGSVLKGLTSFVRKMGSEVFKQQADRVLEYLDDPGRIREFVRAIDRRKASLMADLIPQASMIAADLEALGFERKVLPNPVWRIIDSLVSGEKVKIKDFSLVAVRKILNWRNNGDNSFYVKTYCPGSGKNKILPGDAFSDSLCDWMCGCLKAVSEINALAKIREACPNLEFLGFAWHYINRFREENNLILLSDTNDLLQRIIGGSDAPFIYERIGVILRHFLIDEFQDTSHMQWSNLKPLVADSLSTGCDNLIIGDEKQAIYRFRNSDSSLLHHVVASHDFPDDHVIRGNCSAENTNHRSAPGIVRFNNALFSRIARNCGVEGYENTVQSTFDRKASLGSYIKIYDTSALDEINGHPAEFDITAREILRQHAAGYGWRNIAVLVRKRSEAVRFVNYLLTYYPQIKVLSDEALLLRNSSAVKTIISMLKLVDQSYSAAKDNSVEDRSGQPVYASAGDIRLMISRYEYFIAEGYGTEDALRMALEPTHGDHPSNITDSIIDIRSSHPAGLVSLVETIIARKIPEKRRRSEYAYIAAFQDEVVKYCTSYNPSVHAFLGWWDDHSAQLAIGSGSGQDAVAVMTVHKSKGLQWDCVHVPVGDWDMVRSKDSEWVSLDSLDFVSEDLRPPLIAVDLTEESTLEGSPLRDAALSNRAAQFIDNLNATYVAYTRSQRELCICFAKSKAAGAEVFKALAQPPVGDQSLCLDLAASLRPDIDAEPAGLKFEFGEPTVPEKTADHDAPSPELRDYKVFFREDTAALTTIDDATSDVGDIMDDLPSDDIVVDPPGRNGFDEARALAAERGTHLHAIMSDIVKMSDIDAVVDRAAVRYSLSESEAADYRGIIDRAFAQADQYAVRWFSPEATVYKEQSIYVPENDSTFRPDRIVVCPDGSVDVIDYKFTVDPLPSHDLQVELYVGLLRAMGYRDVQGYLWYPELNIVKSV